MSRVKSRVKSQRVVEQRLAVIRVMTAVKDCILRFQKFLELQLVLAIKKFMHVCSLCVYIHMWMFVYI